MRIDITPGKIAWGIAMGCAALLLFGPLGGRTTRVYRTGSTHEAVGVGWIVLFAGVLALLALVIGRSSRPGVTGAVVAASIAFAAFAMATWSAGSYALAFSRGGFPFSRARLLPGDVAVVPAAGPPFFALFAGVGAVCCMVLVIAWRRPDREER